MTAQKKVNRIGEIILAILGGVFGLLGAVLAIGFGAFADTISNGVAALLCSVMGIVAIFFLSSKPKVAAWLLLCGGVGVLISVSLSGVLPSILMIIAGVMCLVRK